MGAVPTVTDKRVLLVPAPCGKCTQCMKKKAREWNIRLQEELQDDDRGIFITLTFSNEAYTKINAITDDRHEGYARENKIAKKAVRLFLERWRKKYKKSLKHWLVTELGHEGTENIHIHGIVWTDAPSSEIERIWEYGFTWIGDKRIGTGYVNRKTINYITKYVTKKDEKHKHYEAAILTSAGIGKGYLQRRNKGVNQYNATATNTTYTTTTGHKISMPTYFKKKIYTDEEREKIWLQKLDEEYTYIGKTKIKRIDEKAIKETQEYQQQQNDKMGYGNRARNQNEIRIENERRNELALKRIKAKS